jgi:dihydrofolate reductase
MRRLILLMHSSLDGFVATTDGRIDWIHIDNDMFDKVERLTDQSDTALYGRVTWEMMDSYWPGAADLPNATRHDIEHGRWYMHTLKVVVSNTMKGRSIPDTEIIGDRLAEQVRELKQRPGKNILMLGSPSAANALMQHQLIDEYRLYINPVLLGEGIPLFGAGIPGANLKLLESFSFPSGVVSLHYELA